MKPKIFPFGPFLLKFAWDWKCHWLTTKKDHRHYCWFHFGPCVSPDGLVIVDIIIFFFGFGIGWLGLPKNQTENSHEQSQS